MKKGVGHIGVGIGVATIKNGEVFLAKRGEKARNDLALLIKKYPKSLPKSPSRKSFGFFLLQGILIRGNIQGEVSEELPQKPSLNLE